MSRAEIPGNNIGDQQAAAESRTIGIMMMMIRMMMMTVVMMTSMLVAAGER